MPENNKVSKKEFNRKVAGAVLAYFRAADGKLVTTGEQIVDKLHKALVELGDPLDYRVSLELLKSFGFVSETLGLAYFADVKPKLDKVVGAIVHNTLVSVEANTAAQKAAVLLLLTQDAEAYHKACVSAKDAAELLNDVLDISSTPQQTPQQTGEPAQADDAEKGDTPMETEEAEKRDAPTEATMTEADLGAVLGGDIAKLPLLPDQVHDDMASPQAQRIVPGDDHAGDATAQTEAQAQAQAPAPAHGRGKGTLTPPLNTGKRKAEAQRRSNKRRKNNGFTCTFHKVNKPKVSRNALAVRNLEARECDGSKNLKVKVIGLVEDNGKTSGLAQRKVKQLFPGYHMLADQLEGHLLKVETYHTRKYVYGELYLPMKVCFSHYPGRSRRPETIFRPHRNIKEAADKPGDWIEPAGENYLYYPNSDEIDAAAKYGDEFRVPKPTGVSRATSAADQADDSADDSADSADDQASGDDSGDEGSGDE